MDDKQNEQLLGEFLDKADKKFAALVGITALGIEAMSMPQDEFRAFLSECINQAHDLHKAKLLGAEVPEQETGDQ